jgi:phage terminase large subunit-like protein
VARARASLRARAPRALAGLLSRRRPLQQRPAPAEGGILKRRWWRFYDRASEVLPHFTTIAQSWDTSFTDTEDSSFVVGQLWGCFGADRYLLRQIRARMDFTETLRAIRKLTAWGERNHTEQAARWIYIEQGQRPGDHLAATEHDIRGCRRGP